jgi:hypothetical protein
MKPLTTVGGVYKHYKGGRYTVIGVATESTNDRPRRPVVVYVSLEKGTINVRDEAEFHQYVDPAPSDVDQPLVPRFELEGERE